MDNAKPVLAALAIFVAGIWAYVVSYAVLAYRSNSCNPWYPYASYRVSQDGGQSVAAFYWPIHAVDRQVRPEVWAVTWDEAIRKAQTVRAHGPGLTADDHP